MDSGNDYFFVCSIEELKEKEGKRYYINDTDIAVFKIQEKIYVVSNLCPHQHAPSIYEGIVENDCVICPLHGWTFSLTDGNLHSGSRGLDTYEVKIRDGKVYANVKPKELSW